MKLTTRSVVLTVACLGVSAILIAPAFAQVDSQVGIWKLNVAKSKYSPGPAPTSATTTIEAAGMGTKVSVDQTQTDGTTNKWGFTGNYDGKDSPTTGNNPDADMIARTRINANTIQTIAKKTARSRRRRHPRCRKTARPGQ